MLDLLGEVQGNQATSSTFVGANTPYIQAGHSPSGPDRVCGNEPDQHDLSPPSNGKSSKQGLFAKYRAKRLSDASKSPRSSEDKENRMGNQAGSEYSPLGSQMRSLSLGQDERMQDVADESLSQKDLSILEKMKAYRRRRKSMAKSTDSSNIGPLEEGAKRGQNSQILDKHEPSSQLDKEELSKFFELVSQVKALLAEIVREQKNVELERQNMRILIHPGEIKAAQQAIQDQVSEVTLTCKTVKSKLDQLDQLYARTLESDAVLENDETVKLHLTVMAGLSAKASEVIKTWQRMQSSWAAQDVEEVGQKLHVVTGQHFSDEQVQEVLDNGNAEQLYRQALTDNISGAHVRKTLADVQERHEQFRQLEASLAELHEVFVDLSILVADQGAVVDSISNWVENTAMTMQESLIQLHQAKVSRRSAAQKKAATFVTGVGLVAGGVGLTATGVGAVAGVPMMIAGAAAVGASGIGGMT